MPAPQFQAAQGYQRTSSPPVAPLHHHSALDQTYFSSLLEGLEQAGSGELLGAGKEARPIWVVLSEEAAVSGRLGNAGRQVPAEQERLEDAAQWC